MVEVVSTLTRPRLMDLKEEAVDDIVRMLLEPDLDDIVHGHIVSNRGEVYKGIWRPNKEEERAVYIHRAFMKPNDKHSNTEIKKILNFVATKKLIEDLEGKVVVAVPQIYGQQLIVDNREKNFRVRDYIVEAGEPYVPEERAVKAYVIELGKAVAQFLYVGMVNVLRHLIPTKEGDTQTTYMIDLDEQDSHTFKYTLSDMKRGLNYDAQIERENAFVANTYWTLIFPKDRTPQTRDLYLDAIREELQELHPEVKDRFVSILV